MRTSWFLVPAIIVVGLLAGCRGGADRAADHHHEKNLPPVGAEISVSFDGKVSRVTVASVSGAPSTTRSMIAIWRAAWPAEDPAQLKFDLVGSDGFRAMSRPKCTRLLTGEEIAHASIDVATHDTTFDEELKNLPGCYRVRAVVAIEASR